jgi:YD repeat-containing protein
VQAIPPGWLTLPPFHQPVVPLSSSDEALTEAAEVLLAVKEYRDGVAQNPLQAREFTAGLAAWMENYLAELPDSPLVAGFRAELGIFYRATGRYSLALEHWRAAWEECAQHAEGNGRYLGDRVLPQLASLLASLGRVEELDVLFRSQQGRTFSDPASAQLWVRTQEAFMHMLRKPEIAYRCGPIALFNASRQGSGQSIGALHQTPSPVTGFSLADLEGLSSQHHLGFAAAFRPPGTPLVIPAVVHWNENHYAAVVAERNGGLLVQDPTFGASLWVDAATLEAEASGYFLIPASVGLPAGWRGLAPGEAAQVFGKGYPQAMDDASGPECSPPECCEAGAGGAGTGSGTNECGLATWRVHEPNINLEIRDIPMHYETAWGPDFVLNLQWRQRYVPPTGSQSHFAGGWASDLLSWIDGYPAQVGGTNAGTFILHWGNGFQYQLQFLAGATISETEYFMGLWAVRTVVSGRVTQIEVYFRNGSVERYAEVAGQPYGLWLAERKDATGQALTFTYEPAYQGASSTRLRHITTADGAQFQFLYQDLNDPYLITEVRGPDSRSVTFQYGYQGASPYLAGITDAVGLVSSFGYDFSTWWVTQLQTPYGLTRFAHYDAGGCWLWEPLPLSCPGVDRAVQITEPDNSRQLYLFYDNSYDWWEQPVSEFAGIIPPAFAPDQIPVYAPGDPPVQSLDLIRDQRNSHHWNRQQTALLSTTNFHNFTAADYRLSRTKHWLITLDTNSFRALRSLSWLLPPSADGATEAQPVFYDYAGKDPSLSGEYYPYTAYAGTNSLPAVLVRRMPDGTTHYRFFERNHRGMKTREIERWVQGGAVTSRTNTFRYATGSGNQTIDHLLLVEQKGPYSELIFGYGLHPTYPDQIKYMTNAVGEVTTFEYDAFRRLTTKLTHAGLLSTYTYSGTTKRLATVVDSIAGSPLRTNSYTWLNGYPRTHTDPNGLTRTFTYDFLGRLSQTAYPDGTTEIHYYSLPPYTGFNSSGATLPILDRVSFKDRLNNYWRTIPNRLRQTEKLVEPSTTTPGGWGTETTLTYCGCGSPTAVVRASNTGSPETTAFEYDYQGNLIRLTLPDNTSVTNRYDRLGRLQVREDALMKLTNAYDNLGRLLARSNALGRVEGFGYDLRDRVIASTNAAGVWFTNQYDTLGRLLVRSQPDGGKEYWSYTLGQAEATRYTNQIGKITTWAYDAAQRRTNEIQVGVYTNSFLYTPGDDLRELRDGKSQKTTWTYDPYGRVAYKYDHLGTNVLAYLYDANSRLTNRWSRAKGNTAYRHDAVGSLTNVDYPAGTADLTFRYDAFHRLTHMVDAAGTTQFRYRPGGLLLSEEAPWPSSLLTHAYHAAGLRVGLSLQQPSGFWTNGFGYDAARRLTSVVSPAGTFTYTYQGAGLLWTNLALPNTARITNAFDSGGRLLGTWLRTSGGAVINQHEYLYNPAHQRTRHTRQDGSYYTHTYDNLGQLVIADSTVAAEDRGYVYDPAQNLTVRTNATTPETFTPNSLNQYTSGPGGTFTCDGNGNLTYYGTAGNWQRYYTYNAENQLTSVPVPGYFYTLYTYDGLGRRRVRVEHTWNGSAWVVSQTVRYLYDGMRVI